MNELISQKDLLKELRKNPKYIQVEKDLKFNFELGDAIVFRRVAKGWSQKKLAKKLNIRKKYISEIENYLGNPTLDFIRRLCDVLDIDLKFIYSKKE